MNHSDSEKISAILEESGFLPAPDKNSADLLVLNSCSVRQSAFSRTLGQVANFPEKKIVVAGCVLPEDKKKLEKIKNLSFWSPDEYFLTEPKRASDRSAFVPIMTGCNNFCTYCAVPYTRGREYSRPAKEILKEVRTLAKQGYKEIILLGQNVNSYQDGRTGFAELLEKIEKIPGKFWLNFLTSHPKDMSDKLIKIFAKSKKISPYLHLPIQSGDNHILKEMNRRYTAPHYQNLAKKIEKEFKKYRPDFPPLALSTDIIVGFPGETKKQFENSKKLAEKIGFDMIYIGKYSPRPGTISAKMPDNIPPQEKKRRERSLEKVLRISALKKNKKYLGKEIEVLISAQGKDFILGKTNTGKTVKIKDVKAKPGLVIKVKITGATPWGLAGTKI